MKFILFLMPILIGILLLSSETKGGNMILKTSAFQPSEAIPEKYTCDGANVSPELMWEGAPKESKSFALICDDPDAPVGTFNHWVLYALPADQTSLPENLAKK